MGRFLDAFFDLAVLRAGVPAILEGLVYTVGLALTVIATGLVLGCATAVLRATVPRWIERVLVNAIDVIRAVPPLALLVGVYFALPFLGLTLPGLVCAWATLSIILAAFVAEIVFGGLTVLERGQWDAARALGLTYRKALLLIALPQALRLTAAPLTNRTVAIAKNTALASVIAVPEVLSRATSLQAAFANTTPLTMAAIAYLALFLPLIALCRWVERRYPQRR